MLLDHAVLNYKLLSVENPCIYKYIHYSESKYTNLLKTYNIYIDRLKCIHYNINMYRQITFERSEL